METARRTSWLSQTTVVLMLVVGLVLLGVMIGRVGTTGLLDGLHAIGPWLFPYLLLEAVPIVLHTAGWAACSPAPRLPLSFGRLLCIRVAGSSIDEVTPTATLGGEVAKVLLLEPWMRRDRAMAMVFVNKASITLAKMGFITLGLLYTTRYVSLPKAMQWSASLTVALITLGLIGFVAFQYNGMMSKLIAVCSRLGIARKLLQSLQRQVVPLDMQLKTYYCRYFWRYLRSLCLHLAAYLFEVVKIYLLLRCLLQENAFGVGKAAMVTVVVMALDQMFFFVPARLGTLEGVRFVILSSLGVANVYALAFGLIVRLEKLLWSGVGLLLYAFCSRATLPVKRGADRSFHLPSLPGDAGVQGDRR